MDSQKGNLKTLSQRMTIVAQKKNPQAMAIFLYHLVKQHPRCGFVQDMQKGGDSTQNLLERQFQWDCLQIRDFFKQFNELIQYFPKKS